MAATAAMSQKAQVERFEAAPMDLTAQQHARLDLHGEKCALVKVQVVAPGVTFQGNIIGTTDKYSSEYWVYMTDGTKMLKIAADTFLPFMYTFPEPLKGGVTYVLTLLAPQSAAPAMSAAAVPAAVNDPYSDDVPLTKDFKVYSSDGRYGFKHNGKVVIPAKYDDALTFGEGLAPVELYGRWGFIDKNGTMVIPAQYDGAWWFSGGLAGVKINGRFGFIDKYGNMAIPAKYEHCFGFSQGLAPVRINGKYGYIDKTDTMVIPAIYDFAKWFLNGKAEVMLNGRTFTIDLNGREIK